jgi:translocation and assembly module TamB
MPPGWRIEGEARLDARILGIRAQPSWLGQLQLQQLAVRSVQDGIEFSDGQLLARLDGDQMTIERLQLRGAGGVDGGLLSGQGRASWSRAPDGTPRPEMTLSLQARSLRLLARTDRRLTLSGRIDSRLSDGLLDLASRLGVDQALLLLPDETTPRLGRDVVIRGSTVPVPLTARLPFRLRLRSEVHLGNRVEVRGLGLQTMLQGQLLVEAQPGRFEPILTGEVRTVRGSYQAYGQRLQIERGLIRFNGPYDNPSLDLLALRPHPTQKVGVEIGGTAQAPRLRLYADPDMPDNEKLAWLVLGRPC